jgi:hypothetical protein
VIYKYSIWKEFIVAKEANSLHLLKANFRYRAVTEVKVCIKVLKTSER